MDRSVELRHGYPWLPEEDRQLTVAFHSGISTTELAKRHERGVGAIDARLERLGLINTRRGGPSVSVSIPADESIETALSARIDQLMVALADLKDRARDGLPDRHVIAPMIRAYDHLDALLMTMVAASDPPEEADQAGDPLPDRLRQALAGLVRACVADLMDRHIAIRMLGLEGDGERMTLARLGRELGRSAERIRQRRKRAYRSINAALPRRVASAARLRAVLSDLSAETDWADPVEAARAVVRFVNDNVTAAQQITLMMMLASGAAGRLPSLRRDAEQAAMDACRDPELLGHWKLDRWADAAEKSVLEGQFTRFDAPPDDMIGLKRSPMDGNRAELISLPSNELGRLVACESGMEVKIFTWLERSEDVRWYQEQPIALRYKAEGRDRSYYPDAAVWDREGRVVVVEVKPVFTMFRRRTLEKGLAAIAQLQSRGIAYLLVDSSGHTLADLARHPYDVAVAEEIEELFVAGELPFRDVRNVISRARDRFDFAAFVSMVVNRDWAVTEMPVTVSRLPIDLSFRPLLGLADWSPPP